jgi:membrane protease YdiL (CAAX protease family)
MDFPIPELPEEKHPEVPPPVRLPSTWEANLMSAGLLIWVLIVSIALALLLDFAAALVIAQLLILAPVLVWALLRNLPLRETFRLRPISIATALESMLIGAAAWPIISAAATLLEKPLNLIGPYPSNPAPSGILQYLAYAVTFVIIAPLTEEPIYRGFILRAGLRRGTWAGILLSGFLFGLVHSQIAALLPITFLGIVFGWLSHRSGSIYNTVLAHGCYNLVPTVFFLAPSIPEFPDWALYAAALAAVPVLALLLWLFRRTHPDRSADNPPREDSSILWTFLTLAVVVGLFLMMAGVEIWVRSSSIMTAGSM